MENISRKEAIQRTAVLLGVTVSGSLIISLLKGCASEVGATQLLNYDEIPGIYEGCISLSSVGGKTWAL